MQLSSFENLLCPAKAGGQPYPLPRNQHTQLLVEPNSKLLEQFFNWPMQPQEFQSKTGSTWAYYVKAKTGHIAREPGDYLSNFYQPSWCLQAPQNKVIIIMLLAEQWVQQATESTPRFLQTLVPKNWDQTVLLADENKNWL